MQPICAHEINSTFSYRSLFGRMCLCYICINMNQNKSLFNHYRMPSIRFEYSVSLRVVMIWFWFIHQQKQNPGSDTRGFLLSDTPIYPELIQKNDETYRLTLISCRNRNWLHVGSNPSVSTKFIPKLSIGLTILSCGPMNPDRWVRIIGINPDIENERMSYC